ncbi:MAG TPA: phage tail tube protein [Solirubrobacterales bacterium]|jgi:hypothetical protein
MPGRSTNEPSNYFALGKQSAKDTEATTFFFFRHLDGTGLDPDEQTQSVREGGDGQEVGFVHKTAISMDGDVVANARPERAARGAAWTLGADKVEAGVGEASGAAQVHFGTPTSTLPYLTAEQMWGDVIERVSNVQLTNMVIEGEAGRPLKITHSMVAGGTPYRRNAAASALTPTRETGQPYFYPGGSYVIDGAGNTKITKFKSTVERGLDTDIRTTSLFREDVVALNFDSSLEFTLKYEEATMYDKVHYLSGTTISPNAIGLATGAFKAYTEFGAGTGLRFFELNHPLIVYTGARVNKLDPDGKTMYLDITAMGVRGATHQVFTRTQTASGGAF